MFFLTPGAMNEHESEFKRLYAKSRDSKTVFEARTLAIADEQSLSPKAFQDKSKLLRLKEPSTIRGLFVLAGVLGWNLAPDQQQAILAAVFCLKHFEILVVVHLLFVFFVPMLKLLLTYLQYYIIFFLNHNIINNYKFL